MFDAAPEKHRIARQTARMLLEIEAISFNAATRLIFTSGWASPVYTDMRKIISHPRLRRGLSDLAAETIVAEVATLLHAPAAWSAVHGGIAEIKPAG